MLEIYIYKNSIKVQIQMNKILLILKLIILI